MIDVYNGRLFVGNQDDLFEIDETFNVVHAAKEPFHRKLVGFSGSKCPPNKYFYEEGRRCSLCIIDFPKKFQWEWFPVEMLKATMKFIDNSLAQGNKVFIHCNQGLSRAPSIAFMYMVSRKLIDTISFEDDLRSFVDLYPKYNPAEAIFENVRRNYPFSHLKGE